MTPTSIPEVEAGADDNVVDFPTDDTEISTPTQEDIDQALLADFQARQAAASATRQVTFQDLYSGGVALVGAATGRRYTTTPKLSEASAVKLFELTMMWVLNHRGQAIPEFVPGEGGEVVEEPLDPFIPNEIIGGDAEETN